MRYSGINQIVSAAAAANDQLTDLRRAAAERCAQMAWPTIRQEEWRRTNVADFDLDNVAFELAPLGELAPAGKDLPVSTDWLRTTAATWDGEDGPVSAAALSAVVTMHNSHISQAWRSPSASGLQLYSLTRGISLLDGTPVPQALLARAQALATTELAVADTRFIPFALAAHGEALLVHCDKNHVSKTPVVIDQFFSAGQAAHNSLVIILADASSEGVVLQRLQGASEGLLNHVVISDLAPNAAMEIHLVQALADDAMFVANDRIAVQRDARLVQVSAQMGSGFAKVRSTADLLAPNANVWLDGIYCARHSDHFDIRSVQNHRTPQAWSRAFYKGVVRDSGRAIYQGLIFVDPTAAKTDSYLSNKNMLLSEKARVDSIPCLNILTNDVKCSHGSSTGTLDPDEIFYLQNRGFDPDSAKSALVGAYLGEIVDRLPSVVVPWVRERTEAFVQAPAE